MRLCNCCNQVKENVIYREDKITHIDEYICIDCLTVSDETIKKYIEVIKDSKNQFKKSLVEFYNTNGYLTQKQVKSIKLTKNEELKLYMLEKDFSSIVTIGGYLSEKKQIESIKFLIDNKRTREIRQFYKVTESTKVDELINNYLVEVKEVEVKEVEVKEVEVKEVEVKEVEVEEVEVEEVKVEEVKEVEVKEVQDNNPIVESIRLDNLINQFENTEIIKVLQEFCKTKNLIIKDNKNYTMIYKKEKNKKRDKMLSEIQFKKKSIRFFINERHLTEEITNLSDTQKSSIGEYSFEFTHDIFDNINQSKILEIILNNFRDIINEQ